ncbi:MAG TPA: acyltransferase [Pyrinomonadaceae bacterium]|nr:acyltransferase [Pyrinomonadaceae bacterium]
MNIQKPDIGQKAARYEGLDALRVFSSFGVVFLHVNVSAGFPNSLWLFLKFRDFALPVMVMSCFFVLTVSLTRQPDGDFESFFSRRLKRLWIPLFIWTFAYSLSEAFLFPWLLGADTFGELPPTVFFTGYRHLWFLQFIFVGSLLIYPLIKQMTGEPNRSRIKLSTFCFGLSILYGFLFYSFLQNYTDWDNLSPESDMSLRIFVSQAGNYIFYIPVAVGLAMASGRINELFARARFRRLSLAVVLITMLVHVGTNGVPFSREIYGIAVFLAALQPWEKIRFRGWQILASYSYGIYILHFLPVQILWLVVAAKNIELDGTTVFGVTVIVYFASFAAAVLIRKLFPADWLIPSVAVFHEQERETSVIDKISFAALRENTGEK